MVRFISGAWWMLLALAVVSGCAKKLPSVSLTVVDFDFAQDQESVFNRRFSVTEGVHYFTSSFSGYQGKGIWTLGESAAAHLYLLGTDAVLEIDCSTRPALSRQGQTLTIVVNDHTLGIYPIADGWQQHYLTVPIPDEVMLQGLNRLDLRPGLCPPATSPGAADADADTRPLGIFLRRLKVQATLDDPQQRRWADLIAVPEPDPQLALITAPERLTRPAMQRDRNELPDVMVVLMDAARADHYSYNGYERITSPAVDALAADAVVCPQMFSVSPFTLTATTSLLTGRNWRDHEIIEKGQALGQSFWTLAKLFRDAGYLTIGFSDNPYVGTGTNLDQGFIEFTEVWKHPRHKETQHLLGKDRPGYVPHRLPEMLEWLFTERLEKGLGGGPVFSYLHIMPPHGPYVPGEEHDHFSDPSYAGLIDGSTAQYTELVNHRQPTNAADVAQLMALYDGNLHRSDASVGRIVDAWRNLERERQLLLIVLSDHGEAFDEHGRFGHLSTVYDEMIHVPTVFWPREQWSHLTEVAQRYLALTDVMPLLLAKVGIALPDGSQWHQRFIDLMEQPDRARRDRVVARSFVDSNHYGLRTERYLAIYNGLRVQELYDLHSDPGAQHNLRLEQPELYSSLIAQLRSTLARAAVTDVETGTLSDEDIKALKAVGYI